MSLYAKFATGFPADPKMVMAGERGEHLYFRAVLHCREHLTDGVIHRASLQRIGLGIGGKLETHAARLVEVGLWIEREDDYEVHDYLEYNPSREKVLEERRKASERRANGARASAERRASVACPDPTRPDVLTEHMKNDVESGQPTKKRSYSPSEDFTPTDAHCEYARQHGLVVDSERDHWLDWCTANGRKYKNLNAGFSTWLRQAVGFGRGGAPIAALDEIVDEPKLVLPPARVEVCPVCDSSLLAHRGGVPCPS